VTGLTFSALLDSWAKKWSALQTPKTVTRVGQVILATINVEACIDVER